MIRARRMTAPNRAELKAYIGTLAAGGGTDFESGARQRTSS